MRSERCQAKRDRASPLRIMRDVYRPPPAQRPCEQRTHPGALGGAPLVLNRHAEGSPLALGPLQPPHGIREGALPSAQKSWMYTPDEREQIVERVPDAGPCASEQREEKAPRRAHLRRNRHRTIRGMSHVHPRMGRSASEIEINQFRNRVRLAPEGKRLTQRSDALVLWQSREVKHWLPRSL